MISAIKPRISRDGFLSLVSDGKKRVPKKIPRIPIGGLIKKIALHKFWSTKKPPRMGPTAGATNKAIQKQPRATPCSEAGKVRRSKAEPSGRAIPPPKPCKARAAIKNPRLGAIPVSYTHLRAH